MFSADLSWNDETTEKVGQRRERRARKREDSISSSTSGSRTGTRKEESTSQTTSFSSIKGSFRRPSITTLSRHQKKPSLAAIDAGLPLRDPVQQPDYVYSAKLEPRLPSGASLDPPPPFGSVSNAYLPVRSYQLPRTKDLRQYHQMIWFGMTLIFLQQYKRIGRGLWPTRPKRRIFAIRMSR